MSGDLLTFHYPVARKSHACEVCGCTIAKGTKHHYQTSAYDGSVSSWRVHSDCAEMHWHHNDWREGDDQSDDYYLDEYRGYWPHAVTRIEYRAEMAERKRRARRTSSQATTPTLSADPGFVNVPTDGAAA